MSRDDAHYLDQVKLAARVARGTGKTHPSEVQAILLQPQSPGDDCYIGIIFPEEKPPRHILLTCRQSVTAERAAELVLSQPPEAWRSDNGPFSAIEVKP